MSEKDVWKYGRRRSVPQSPSENVSPPGKASEAERRASTVRGESTSRGGSGPPRGVEERVVSQAGDGDTQGARHSVSEAPTKHQEPPQIHLTQEVRFAVVMYGGISLAIYMNGVAQELLKLVRATAIKPSREDGRQVQHALRSDNDLQSTERVYRKLSQMLVRAASAKDPKEVQTSSPIQTRFVIDILSGSSAGGINAVYLAKALANDQKIDELKDLWITQGDIGLLINDRRPIEGISGLAKQNPPRSLLNSRRMYWKLFEALEEMGADPSADDPSSPNVEELDLYVTATDMAGRPVRLQLADKIVKEYSHRNVFHFRYSAYEHDHDGGGIRNDFRACNNPFLAFAARCTSAHPAAFEPMRFGDVDEVLDNYSTDAGRLKARASSAKWHRFFKEYLRPKDGELEDLAKAFLGRDFNDGGVLDNRPFGHATDAMPLHSAGVPVSRKLVYLDPAPERLRGGFEQRPRPNVAENGWLSLSTLPRYEPIYEDLQRVLERNRLIERVSAIVEGIEERDFKYGGAREERQNSVERQASYTNEQWDETTMSGMVRERGLAWAGYLHLRVTEVTDDLAVLLTRAAGLDEDSDEFRAVRQLVRCWRERYYDPDGEDGKLTEHEFLRRFDVAWRLRRLRFVLAKTDRMLSERDLGLRELAEQAPELNLESRDSSFIEEFRTTLFSIRNTLSKAQTKLRKSRECLWETRADHPLLEAIRGMNIKARDLKDLLEPQTAQRMVENKEDEFEEFRTLVQEHVCEALMAAANTVNEVLPPPNRPLDASASSEEIARLAIRFHYDDFANYDMISHPILYSTGVGEEMARIDVFRISPEDASCLIKEKPDKPKLAGTKLNNFGAFFKEDFRTNDIRWGRLDGAERIITALLPKDEDALKRKKLIEEAHHTILSEEIFANEANGSSSLPVSNPESSSINDTLERFKKKYKKEYETTRKLDPQDMVHSAGRASRVIGDMLEGYAETQRRLPKGGVVWVTRIAQLFWGLVEVAIPNSLASIVFRHGLHLLYFFEALAILLGTLLFYPIVQQFGFVAFAATAAVHGAVLFLEDAMTKKKQDGEQQEGERQDEERECEKREGAERESERRDEEARKGDTLWQRTAKYAFAVLLPFATVGFVFTLAALGLDVPRSIVDFLTDPPGTEDSVRGTIVRGAIMFAIVAGVLLVTVGGISRRLKR